MLINFMDILEDVVYGAVEPLHYSESTFNWSRFSRQNISNTSPYNTVQFNSTIVAAKMQKKKKKN